jgi:hypothetical protein
LDKSPRSEFELHSNPEAAAIVIHRNFVGFMRERWNLIESVRDEKCRQRTRRPRSTELLSTALADVAVIHRPIVSFTLDSIDQSQSSFPFGTIGALWSRSALHNELPDDEANSTRFDPSVTE